ncbi:MAG: SprT family zinc-dependent metalloprotease [Slackia sp.]|nr:SprT family zinc-dependent metalloprotease [Slackia sp.]
MGKREKSRGRTCSTIVIDGIEVSVVRRAGQKRAYIRVKPPDGRVEISAPMGMSDAAIARFVREHADWIGRHRRRAVARAVESPGAPTPEELAEWRAVVEAFTPALVEKWAPVMGVEPGKLAYRNMVSRWGSCNVKTGRICINVQLAAHPPECLEYVVVHELCHLLEASHGPRFKALMDAFLPDWRIREAKLRGGIRR